MARNWVLHRVCDTPPFMTAEDLSTATPYRLSVFHQSLKFIFLVRVTSLPAGLYHDLRSSRPESVPDRLRNALLSGDYMDSGFVDEYLEIVDEVSWRIGGYPRECVKVWRSLREAVALVTGQQIDVDAPKDVVIEDATPIFRFVDLPPSIKTRIYQICLRRGRVSVGDWSTYSVPTTLKRRTEYEVDVGDSRVVRKRTTYTCRLLGSGTWPIVALFQVNRSVGEEAATIFYGENQFRFLGTAKSTLAFLHDRMPRLRYIRNMSMRFCTDASIKFKGCYNITGSIPPAPRTFIGAWRRIFNALVHTTPGLKAFELLIDKDFWWHAPWYNGAEAVFTTPALGEPHGIRHYEGARNFLQHVARLAEVEIRLTIDETEEDEERGTVRRELDALMRAAAATRPWLALDEYPACTCGRRLLLSESCIWDKYEAWRRPR
ncbi:hypothetical protein P152DRAFT_458971 [Eremomyces bilateralis CBS 781.70]|uniref:Uncharacterized protein n=1 Tax=Eremomyces bilateralis CBS 781.70 TaxID=1392243 RepID=A0A6G1G1N0_9PEZI|nr:uncharacterized protein P152DRAFT_458971 [Eremomyces bilateralis CBS 781.70]KAF1812017.1 hypothetical protein P152DRAFT_458971 [Eremomyces bilateralis CBS 781.70]